MKVTSTSYKERLTPSIGSYIAMALVFPMVLLAALPFGLLFAVLFAASCLIALLVLATLIAPGIEVGKALQAGRIKVPLDMLGKVEVITGEAARIAKGPGLDSRARLMIRGDIKDLVRVAVIDQNDPTPYLLISSRRPNELAGALGADFAIL